MIKILTLLSSPDDVPHDRFLDQWTSNHGPAAREGLAGYARRHAQLHVRPGRTRRSTPHVPVRIDGIEETWFDDMTAFDRYSASLAAQVLDQSHGTLAKSIKRYFFTEWEVYRKIKPLDEGDGKLKSMGFQTRKPEHTHEYFMRHWIDIHAPLVMNTEAGTNRCRYSQLHLTEATGPRNIPVMEVEINGIAELWFDGQEAAPLPDAQAKIKSITDDGNLFIGAYTSLFFEEIEILPRSTWAPY